MSPRFRGAGAALAVLLAVPSALEAQAFTAARGIGSVTLAWQMVDNTGHRMTDGLLLERGTSMTTSLLLEGEYAVTDRLSITAGIPYVFAKYNDDVPPISGLPYDQCRCWNSSFQDFGLMARYRLGDGWWAVTPVFRMGRPSHDYPFAGEAVVGKNLSEVQLGGFAGARLPFLPSATVQAGYTYAFVESPLDDVSIDRSNGTIDLGYAITRKLYARAAGAWQWTHGGLRAGSPSGDPFLFPGELNTPERQSQRDRVQKTQYWQLGGGLAYSIGRADVFASYSKYIWGRDAHAAQVFGAGVSVFFGLPD